LGGRDGLAGGTWLAVNEHGVVAGLTNRPAAGGRDPSKRSRGELPLALAEHPGARSAVEEFVGRFRPSDFNPAWLLVGDRQALFAIDMSGDVPRQVELGPGVHVLENRPYGAPSPKVARVRSLLAGIEDERGNALEEHLKAVLRDHTIPTGTTDPRSDGNPTLTRADPGSTGVPVARPPGAEAACVHGATYGTRSSLLVRVERNVLLPPPVQVSDGPSCTVPFVDVTALWTPTPREAGADRL
jgi:uncharacterized protein with NRDE domain